MIKILCFGDSNTYGYNPCTGTRYPKGVRWTSILEAELGDSFEVIEEGCNGRTTVFEEPGASWKAGKSSIQVVLNSHKPVDLVILMLGSNDLKNIFHAETPTIAAGAEMLVQMIQAFTREKQDKAAKILLVSPPVIGDGITSTSPFGIQNGGSFDASAITRSKQFRQYYQNIADRYGCLFMDSAEHIRSSEIDSLHLDPDAHEILGKVFADVVRKAYPEECDFLERESSDAGTAEGKNVGVSSPEWKCSDADSSEGKISNATIIEKSCIDSGSDDNNSPAMSQKYIDYETNSSISRLRHIIARLRDPETGCRWDKAQTLDSVKSCCAEEAAEVLAGIDLYNATGNSDNLKEELGDLLMQVVLQSQMAEELGLFNLNDVIRSISEKMIRRHPHVFHVNDPSNGDLEEMIRENQAKDENGDLLTTWAEIKVWEKQNGKLSADAYLPGAFDQICEFIRAAEERKFGRKR